jgi:G3E family GTPase
MGASLNPCRSAKLSSMTNPNETAPTRTPVTILTGFLGSGKTTLLNHALSAPDMARTAVIINEFGEVALDHALAAQSDDSVVVLENGCLCCTVRSDLVGTLNDLYRRRRAGKIPFFDNIMIETSGLAEPGPVLQAFLSEPTLDGLYRVANVIALVDAVNGLTTLQEHEEAVQQAALADRIVITKLDLVEDPQARQRLETELRRINPSATISAASDVLLDLPALLRSPGFDPMDPNADPRPWLNVDAYANAHQHDDHRHGDHGHDHSGRDHSGHDHAHHWRERQIESFCLVRDEPLTREAVQFLLDGITQNLGPSLLRVKGLVNVAEEPDRPAVIQGVQHLLHTMTWLPRWPDADRRTRIVFITRGVVRSDLQEMIELLDRMAARTSRARLRAQERQAPV